MRVWTRRAKRAAKRAADWKAWLKTRHLDFLEESEQETLGELVLLRQQAPDEKADTAHLPHLGSIR